MLKNLISMNWADELGTELLQSSDEGKDTRDYGDRVKSIKRLSEDNPARESEVVKLTDELAALPTRPDYPYIEPSELSKIKAHSPQGAGSLKGSVLNGDKLYDRIYGAWLGRCCGCLLGQVVESWHRDKIVNFLKDTGNYPINRYMSSDISEQLRSKYSIVDKDGPYGDDVKSWINNVCCMPIDDDMNYTIMGLKILERCGKNFTSDDVAATWLLSVPILSTCTAERVAYRNIVNFIFPPYSGSFRNPFREWIGAQIRADFFGYVNPGNPELAAEMAWRDAVVTHIKNGVYGEMFVAAMISAAAVSSDVHDIIRTGLAQVPEKSRAHQLNKIDL